MALTILSVAYPLALVGPDAVGGAEQVLTLLDEALVRAGHRSIVIAAEGSVCAGTLVATPRPPDRLDDEARARAWQHHRDAIARALRDFPIDVVHLHGIDFHQYAPDVPAVLATLHLPPSWYPREVFDTLSQRLHLHCVSRSQRLACPPGTRLLDEIPNGVRLDLFRFRRQKSRFVLALGRVCPEKGFHLAAQAARLAGLPFVLGGQVFPYDSHLAYFERELQPILDAERRFIGPVGLARKRRLLSAARCLVVPSLAPETSSLVAMEALASGTPVVAFRTGALPEIVEHGRTGFLVDDPRELPDALARVDRIDPAECRRAAEERFSADHMIRRYFDTYERLRPPARLPRPSLQVELSVRPAPLATHDEWRELWEQCPTATVFQHPAWLSRWCELDRPREPLFVTLRRGGRLVGLAPFLVYRRGDERVLGLMGGGVSDSLDLLLSPTESRHGLRAIGDALATLQARWDVCEWDSLRADSPLLQPALGDGWQQHRAPQDACPRLALPSSLDDLARVIPARHWANVAYYRRRLARQGRVEYVRADEHSFDELFDALVRLHAARWALEDEPGMLACPEIQAFHRDAARALLGEGLLLLYGLRVDGQLAAVLYGLRDRTRHAYYLSGFDPRFRRLDVGTLVVAHAIEEAVVQGAREFDFLRGREPYKYAWGAKDEWLHGCRAWRAVARGATA